ncbi:MAG: tRNA modification GTPase mnmE [candidate division TM6 bacterium GW2011_GWF2_30_66]|nr:MAG: tRNA modification GTPase mnmE [candidate division TM6 bacterium GW2011_GWF2_30_66]
MKKDIKNISGQIFHQDQETIIAQCTPISSQGAIALIRMSGQDAIEIATKISRLASGESLIDRPTNTINFGWVIEKISDTCSKNIDQVLFLLMRAPKTFTGQDTIEITCHNNQFIVQNIINLAISYGARLAQNGEFTKRAFLNNKIDLVQAEAINELIHSQTQVALKSALAQLDGSLSSEIINIENDLIKALAFSEASFEFIEDENIEFGPQIKNILENILKNIFSLKKTFDAQKQIREGIRIAIIGSVNAGKSSLFNSLLRQNRAIVTNIAGTTRDTIEANIIINSNNATLIDTAGLRETDNQIEKAGIEKSFQEAEKSDIVILVFDNSRDLTLEEATIYQELVNKYCQKIIFVKNKCDITPVNSKLLNNLLSEQKENIIKVSSLENKNLDTLENIINTKIKDLFSKIQSPFLLNKRQFNLLHALEKKLQEILPLISKNPEYEILSYHLRDTISYLSEITGKTVDQKSIDLIFKEFCVGK